MPVALGNVTVTSAVVAGPINDTALVPPLVPSLNKILPPTVALVAPKVKDEVRVEPAPLNVSIGSILLPAVIVLNLISPVSAVLLASAISE